MRRRPGFTGPALIAAVVAALVLSLLAAVPAAGAEGDRPVKTPQRIPRIDNEIGIDGVLDEEVWDRALVMGVNNEVRPGNNIPAPVETDTLLAYSKTHFYVAFRAWDPDPSQIYAHLCDHDHMWNDEWVVITTLNKGFEGDIDEVSVWNVARGSGDIESGWEYPLFGDESGLAAYWRMDEAGWVQGVTLYPTGVHESGGEDTAGTPLLRANHPNPFNPRTTISFSLPEVSHVELTIYDAAGRLVRTLVCEHMAPGPHSAVWDGRTNSGSRAASGVYFCRLSTPVGTESSTMVMVR
jgi:hypothetical protein